MVAIYLRMYFYFMTLWLPNDDARLNKTTINNDLLLCSLESIDNESIKVIYVTVSDSFATLVYGLNHFIHIIFYCCLGFYSQLKPFKYILSLQNYFTPKQSLLSHLFFCHDQDETS